MNEAHEEYSLLDTIFNYIFDFGPSEKHQYLSPHAGRHVVGFFDLLSGFSWRSMIKDIVEYCT